MELKIKSWYVWLWEYTYAEDLPNNLCPFFWKLILAMLLFIPNIIFRIPTSIGNLIFKDKKIERGDARTGIGIFLYGVIFAILFVLHCEYNLLKATLGFYSYNQFAANVGLFMIIVALCILIGYYWKKNITTNKIKNIASNNILVNFTKAWYNNHCPRINWK